MALQHFLLRYNLRTQTLEERRDFGTSADAATLGYAQLEREYRDRPDHADYEIVLIGADSIETVMVTHSRYFTGGVVLPDLVAR